MAWKSTFTQNTDNPNVGTMTSVYTDPVSGAVITTFSARGDASKQSNVTAYVAAAQAQLAAVQAKNASLTNIAATIDAALNA